MVGRDVALQSGRTPRSPGAAVLQLKGLAADGERRVDAVRDVDLTLHSGEIVGVAGVDGNGQSELAEAVAGLRVATRGSLTLNDRRLDAASVAQRREAGLAYVPADRRHVGAVPELSISDNAMLGMQRQLARWRGAWRDESAVEQHAQALVQNFGVRTSGIGAKAGGLSGGNLQKLILGRELMRQPRALVVEQPTRGLDVGAIEAVWQRLLAQRDQGMAILLISAELDEVFALADRIAVMYEGRIVGLLQNNGSAAQRQRVGMLMAGLTAEAADGQATPGEAHVLPV
jgi:simple sugar transport system ATP-binding protein